MAAHWLQLSRSLWLDVICQGFPAATHAGELKYFFKMYKCDQNLKFQKHFRGYFFLFDCGSPPLVFFKQTKKMLRIS